MKVSSINWVKTSNKNEPDYIIMWTNEPLNTKCRISFRTFKNKEFLASFLNQNQIYNKKQAYEMANNL